MIGQRLSELEMAEIIGGNELLISCQGCVDGREHCGGGLAIPFKPGINGAPDGDPRLNRKGYVWTRTSGETIEDITLKPSIDAKECGHFFVQHGKITQGEDPDPE